MVLSLVPSLMVRFRGETKTMVSNYVPWYIGDDDDLDGDWLPGIDTEPGSPGSFDGGDPGGR